MLEAEVELRESGIDSEALLELEGEEHERI